MPLATEAFEVRHVVVPTLSSAEVSALLTCLASVMQGLLDLSLDRSIDMPCSVLPAPTHTGGPTMAVQCQPYNYILFCLQ